MSSKIVRTYLSVALLGTALALDPAHVCAQPPTDAAEWARQGQTLVRQGKFTEASVAYRNAVRLGASAPEYRYGLASVTFEQGNNRAAKVACKAVEKGDRNSVWAHTCRARAALIWNRSALAFDELTMATAMEPRNAEVLVAVGDAHRLRGEVAKAEEAYRKALEVDPARADAHLGLGRLYLSANRRAEAATALRAANQIDPNWPAVLFELSKLVPAQEATSLLQRAVELRPSAMDIRLAYALRLTETGQGNLAEPVFADVLRAAPRTAEAHIGLGRLRLAAQNYVGAEQSANAALEIVPNSHEGALLLADTFAASERVDEAFEQYRVAAGFDPADYTALLKAAELSVRLRRDVHGTAFLDRILGVQPNHARALELYGDLMMIRGDRVQARSFFERALAGQGDLDRAALQAKLTSAR